jgi:D-sedoheptulose 7-phosphate isomerase
LPDLEVTRPEAALREIARARFRSSAEVPAEFFRECAARVALACRDLARALDRGGRLLVWGEGSRWSDAVHVSVEFVHPVIMGKRALPAIALSGDALAQLAALAEPGDVVLILTGGDPGRAAEALAVAGQRGAAAIVLAGAEPIGWKADHVFAVPSEDPAVVQETHETLYHVLWELVHVFLDHPATLR